MQDTIIVRSMTIGDFDAVSALWAETEGITRRSADSRENIGRYLERNPDLSLVAFDNTDLVGTVLTGHDGRRGYINHLVVKHSHRRRGLAARLEAETLSRLRLAGIEKALLFVFVHNEPAQGFWESVGWEKRPELATMSKLLVDDPNA